MVIVRTTQGNQFTITDKAEEQLAYAVDAREADSIFMSFASHIPRRHRNDVWQAIEQQEQP